MTVLAWELAALTRERDLRRPGLPGTCEACPCTLSRTRLAARAVRNSIRGEVRDHLVYPLPLEPP